jgi:UDP-galactopyranose mutase
MTESLLKLKDLVCFSHLRWNFVYQRPQHLISRFTKCFRVYFIEEPIFDSPEDELEISTTAESVIRVVPYLRGPSGEEAMIRLRERIAQFFDEEDIQQYMFWYYTPMALRYSADFNPALVVYDCMDELSAFKLAAPELKELEHELLSKADIVFAGGQSLYEAKKKYHEHIHLFPSSIDKHHFEQARTIQVDLPDQENIPHPRIGFFGVIDERMDLTLLERVARMKPAWHFVMVGPVVKIDLDTLPNFHNIHYLGGKAYNELPHYLAGWDVAMIPFAHNESTRFISPTKTPEYLAAGKPVVSTPIIDVIRPYGNKGLVRIAGTPDEFVRVVEEELQRTDREEWLEKVDDFLAQSSWNKTWSGMMSIIGTALIEIEKKESVKTNGQQYV